MEKMCNEDQLCDKLFIVEYSFRDAHINSGITERLKLSTYATNPRPLELTIVDYAITDEDKTRFIKHINSNLELTEITGQFINNDPRILFGGANQLREKIHTNSPIRVSVSELLF